MSEVSLFKLAVSSCLSSRQGVKTEEKNAPVWVSPSRLLARAVRGRPDQRVEGREGLKGPYLWPLCVHSAVREAEEGGEATRRGVDLFYFVCVCVSDHGRGRCLGIRCRLTGLDFRSHSGLAKRLGSRDKKTGRHGGREGWGRRWIIWMNVVERMMSSGKRPASTSVMTTKR